MSPPRRALVVSFFYPPDPAVGGRRVSKFVEYLPGFGWNSTVLTALTVPGAPTTTAGETSVYANPFSLALGQCPARPNRRVRAQGRALAP